MGPQSPAMAGGPAPMDPMAQVDGLLALTQQATDLVLQAAEQMPQAPMVATAAQDAVMAIQKMGAAIQAGAQMGTSEDTAPVP